MKTSNIGIDLVFLGDDFGCSRHFGNVMEIFSWLYLEGVPVNKTLFITLVL